MKRFAAWLILITALLCIPLLGSAMDLEEWDLTCLYSSKSCTVYELTVKEIADGTSATATDLTYVFTPVASLGAGRAVKPTGDVTDGKAEIAYYEGGVRYGYVDAGMYQSAYFTVTAGGKSYKIPHRASGNESTLRKSIALRYSGADVEKVLEAYYGGGDSSSGDGGDADTGGDSAGKTQKKAVVSDRMNPTFRLVAEDGTEQPVTLVTLGLVDSEVKLGGETVTVMTRDLVWDHDVDNENQRLAIINAKRTGEATMHAKAKAKSDVVRKCDTNRVVVVLRVGKGYSRVLYDGVEGFVMTDALEFYPVGGVKQGEEAPKPGWVSYKGKTNSRQKINVRQNGKNGSRIVDEFKAGTPVWVFGTEGKWAEIEVGGYRAYILKKYLTMDESWQPQDGGEE